MDDLSLEAIKCTKPDGGVVSSSDRKAVIAFLMLSEDELDLRAQRWISADTWKLLSGWPDSSTVPDGPSMWSGTKSAIGRAEPSMVSSASYARPLAAGSTKSGLTRQPKGSAGPGRVADRVAAAVRHTDW